MVDFNKKMTERDIIAAMCLGGPSYGSMKRKIQEDSYRSGRALSGHVKDAHNGIEDPKCYACKEIRMRCGL